MDGRGSPLRTWEKVYWGVFVTAISLFLFNRLKPNPQEAKVRHVLYTIGQCQSVCSAVCFLGASVIQCER